MVYTPSLQLLISVVYSLRKKCWKLVDFGTSSHATSQLPHTTTLAWGTASYRAPELLREDPKYTNKVDIWGLGCILHELITGQKAFNCDWNVHEYATLKPNIEIPLPMSLIIQSHISENIREMLAVEPSDRPRASTASLIYRTYCRFYNEFFNQAIAEEKSSARNLQWRDTMLDYKEWREISEIFPEEERFQRYIAESKIPSKDGAQAVLLWTELVTKAPENRCSMNVCLERATCQLCVGDVLQRFLCRHQCGWRPVETTMGVGYRERWFRDHACIRGSIWRCLRGSMGRTASAIWGRGLVGSMGIRGAEWGR